jgi:hypothetical protein
MRNTMKTVVKKSQVAHLWANQVQPSARNGGGSFYFEGPTIYSYGAHFPIAEHVQNARGEKAVLFTRDTRSVTTSAHISSTRCALNGLPLPVYSVGKVSPYGRTEAKDLKAIARREAEAFTASIPAILLRISRAKSQWRKDYEAGSLKSEAEAVNSFASFAGYRGRVSVPVDLAAATIAAKDAAKRETARQARERVAAEKRRALQAIAYAKKQAEDAILWEAEAAEWRAGTRASLRYYPGTGEGGTFLRLCGVTVETSRGAELPTGEAQRFLRLILAVRKSGQPWEASGLKAEAFGGFPLRSIAADGSIQIGCHTIPWAEVERFAVSVGWCAAGCAGVCEPPCPGCGA